MGWITAIYSDGRNTKEKKKMNIT